MKSIQEKAKIIRGIFKKMGYNSKQISVVVKRYSSINITIKDINISIKDIETISLKYEKIDTCEKTGEILQGCNDYVFVKYDYDILKKNASMYYDYCNDIIENNKENKYLIEIYNDNSIRVLYWNKHNANVPYVRVEQNNKIDYSCQYCANNNMVFAESLIRIRADYGIDLKKLIGGK